MSDHKKHAHDDKDKETSAGAAGGHKPKKGHSLTVTCELVDDASKEDAEKIRADVSTYLKTYLAKRVGKTLKSLEVV